MKKNSAKFEKDNGEIRRDLSGIDNEYFFRGDFENQRFSNINEIEVENLISYIMRY